MDPWWVSGPDVPLSRLVTWDVPLEPAQRGPSDQGAAADRRTVAKYQTSDLAVQSRHLVDRVEDETIRLRSPGFADVFVGREAVQWTCPVFVESV